MIRLLLLPAITLFAGFVWTHTGEESHSVEETGTGSVVYPEHLTGTYTGGFGEQTCRSCHFDYDLNPADGHLTVTGIPVDMEAGDKIGIKITVEREQLGRAGFQITARYADGSQAGKFVTGRNSRLMLSKATPDSLQYVQHSESGTHPTAKNKNSWTVKWKAPENFSSDTVIFNIAANAANGDQSEFGDFIYTEEVKAFGENQGKMIR